MILLTLNYQALLQIFLLCFHNYFIHGESYTCYVRTTYFQEHHITPHVFGEILYENFVFDIPKIFDLCVLYGEGNGPLLTKIVDNIFTQQPKYNDDLQCAIPTIIQVITVHVESKVFLMGFVLLDL